jgi:hypothetical protein
MFVLGEVAVELFQESPSAFLAELRNGRYLKTVSNNKSVLNTIQELGLPIETVAQAGITLVPAQTVEQLMQDRRKVISATHMRTHDMLYYLMLNCVSAACARCSWSWFSHSAWRCSSWRRRRLRG